LPNRSSYPDWFCPDAPPLLVVVVCAVGVAVLSVLPLVR
jgi:hypothetical protein